MNADVRNNRMVDVTLTLLQADGIQSHMHQGYWGVEKTLQVLEHFARFNLPIHFTETTLVSGRLMPSEIVDLNDYKVQDWPTTPAGEERQAQEAIRHYETLFAHHLVGHLRRRLAERPGGPVAQGWFQ